ncbi:MAG TPA: phytanoyl-CoA dioxygenase family protein [Thermoanaerobaculia bacterium]
MNLSTTQRAALAENGFLSIPSLFSPEELEPLREAANELVEHRGPNVVGELDGSPVVRMVFGAHVEHDLFARVAKHPRILGPVTESLGEPAHLFQSRLNVKSSFTGGWAWHQDFNQWYRQDGLRTPRATVIGVFLDDVNPCNGPLLMIPGSHRRGFIPVPDMMDIPQDEITSLANAHGIVPLMGPPGTAIFFDCLTVHGSAPNISPWSRRIFYCNYIPASCHELQPLRAWFHCDTAVAPLTPLADDCLLTGVAQ